MYVKRFRVLLLNVALVALLGLHWGTASAQVATGTITGTVTDAKGAAMSGVSVNVHNSDTGVAVPAVTTNDSGSYTAPFLQPGTYEVTATQSGFATVDHKGIVVQVGGTVRIDVEMPVASQQSLVTVTTEAPVLETEKTESSQTVSESMVSNLPISSRRWEQVTLLTPTVSTDGTGAIAFHGISSMFNSNSVDGANNDNSFAANARGSAPFGSSTDGYVYSPDSIREFQVSSSNYTAEVGHSAGGAVNAVTRSGTSQMHGDLFENLRNPGLNALDPVIKASTPVGQTPTQSVHQQNQFGGSVGGPVIKDKLFYFITYDGYRKSTPIAFTTSNPVGTSPTTGLLCPSEISALQCTSAKGFINNENLGSYGRLLQQDVALGKIDYQATASDHVNFTFNWRNWKEPLSQAFASASNTGLTSGTESIIQDRFIIATWDKVIGSNKVNELRYQYGQDHVFSSPNPNTQYPQVTLSNIITYDSQQVIPSWNPLENRHQITDSFSFAKGQHSFKTGFDLSFVHDSIRSTTPSSGLYQYTGAVTGSLSTAAWTGATGCSGTTDIIFCDWLLDLYGASVPGDARNGTHWSSYGQARDFTQPGNIAGTYANVFGDNFDAGEYSGFFQDTWKARSNLTLNLGLRYDIQTLPVPIPLPNNFDAFTALYTTNVRQDYSGLQPRIGIAWNFTKSSVLRVGFGTFWAKIPLSGPSATRRLAGGQEATFNCTPTQALAAATATNPCGQTGGAGTGLIFPDQLYSQSALAPTQAFVIAGAPAGVQPRSPGVLNPPGDACNNNLACVYSGLDPNLKNPRVYEGEVTFERQLPGNMTFSAGWVVTRGERLPNYWDANLAVPTSTKTYDVVDASGNTQSTSTVPFFNGARLDPTSGGMLAEFSNVNSWYNAFVLTLHKNMSHGIEILANYTYSHATDDGQSSQNQGGEGNDSGVGVLNPYNQSLEQGRSSLDIPNRFTTSVIWSPDYAKRVTNRYERVLASGWSLSTSITASNGTAYSGLDQSSAQPCLVTASTCPAADVALDGGMTGALLSTSRGPMGGAVAFLPRDSFRLPTYANVDLRLSREITIHERYSFEFRAEAFNLFNSAIVQAVNANAFNVVQPGGTGCPASHANTCMVPVSTFGTATTTSAFLLGARQMQFGARFNF